MKSYIEINDNIDSGLVDTINFINNDKINNNINNKKIILNKINEIKVKLQNIENIIKKN